MTRIRGSRMVLHAHCKGRDEAIRRLRHMGGEPAVDDPGRQVPKEVGDMGADPDVKVCHDHYRMWRVGPPDAEVENLPAGGVIT